MKRIAAIVVCLMLIATGALAEDAHLAVAYQYGLAYAPLVVAQQEGLIEKAYSDATGKTLTVEWLQMPSGADINTGIVTGAVDVGFMGVAPAITGVAKNVGYRIFTNLSGQEHGLMTSDPSLTTLESLIGSDKQIALVNIGSIQHLILAKALSDAGLDPHALDANLVAMKHPDGMAALVSGSLPLHLTTAPYIHVERADETLYEIEQLKTAWPKENSFIVGVAAIELHDSDPELYAALCAGIAAAIDRVNADPEGVAQITSAYDGLDPATEAEYLKLGSYSTVTGGVGEMAKFMYENAFVETDPGAYADIVFDNVQGD